ncbi:MAG: O-antigen ligase family protein [Ignavibacterium sp.]|nr:O-antigen ligase family protein [Ignavibacterium sp.]MDW8374511.1 O-antigen ligase family protein [Ignavibacteriales bacterium]
MKTSMANSRFDKKVIVSILSIFSISFLLSLALMQVIAGLLFFMWLLERNEEKKKTTGMILYSIFIFGIIRLLSIVFSEYPSISYQSIYKEAIFYTSAIALSYYYKALEKEEIIKILTIFIIGASLISLIGIFRFYSGEVHRAQSYSGSYTVFSSYLLVAFSFSLFFYKNLTKIRSQIFWAIIYVIIFTGIFTSLGRANLIIAILIFLFAIVLKQIRFIQFFILLLSLLIILGINIIYPTKTIEQRVSNLTQLSDRDIIWQGAYKIAFEKPVLGFGPRTFSEVFPDKEKFNDKGVGGWHNDFLQIYFESGIIGLLSFIFLIYMIFRESVLNIKNLKIVEEYKSISISIIFSVFSLLLTTFTSGFITSTYISVVFVFLITLIDRISLERNEYLNLHQMRNQ